MRFTILALAALVLVVATSAGGSHCYDYGTSEAEVFVEPYYVDNDLCQPECIFSIWPYEESNGIEGLQRRDEVVDDTCHGMIGPDTYVW